MTLAKEAAIAAMPPHIATLMRRLRQGFLARLAAKEFVDIAAMGQILTSQDVAVLKKELGVGKVVATYLEYVAACCLGAQHATCN